MTDGHVGDRLQQVGTNASNGHGWEDGKYCDRYSCIQEPRPDVTGHGRIFQYDEIPTLMDIGITAYIVEQVEKP